MTATQAEAVYRQNKKMSPEQTLSNRVSKNLKRFQRAFAESRMWDRVGERVRASSAQKSVDCAGVPLTVPSNMPVRYVDPNKVDYVGTDQSEVIVGNDFENHISGRGGDDYICGGGGRDSLSGGSGNDLIWGGTGTDTLVGESGNDTLRGGRDLDLIYGGDGNDLMSADIGG